MDDEFGIPAKNKTERLKRVAVVGGGDIRYTIGAER